MTKKQLENIIPDFNFNRLNDPEFQEDSVREEIVLPIIKRLGYTSEEPYRIIRSRKLTHPFVHIGSIAKEIKIIPDYVLEVDKKVAWLLDAKAPNQPIVKSVHVEQAYSYAIHPETRVNYFVLCNGKEFALYSVSEFEPILHVPIQGLPSVWDNIQEILSPKNVLNKDITKLKKDFGLHLKRLGISSHQEMVFFNVPIRFIHRLGENLYSFGSGVKFPEDTYVASFDFGTQILNQLKNIIPKNAFDLLSNNHGNNFMQVVFGDVEYYVSLSCRLAEELKETDDEIFMPLVIVRIIE